MLKINTNSQVEKDFNKIIRTKYNGDVTKALVSFIEYERVSNMSWNKRFQYQLNKLRQTARKIGGISDHQIDTAIVNYREKKRSNES
ncbi:hypothetical protein H8E88_27275 [candidate division KSB1 bacterium]|nr:hypothetical protein [candidate division KSB1 bacterium]